MEEWEFLLAKIVGKTCWSMIGPAAGSWFKLDFGDELKRDAPVNNERLREEQQQFVGEYTLWVRMTGWTLYLAKKRLCHCNDSNASGGPMDIGLRQLKGKKVLHFKSGKSPAELGLNFSEGYRLVLSDWEGVDPEHEGYTLFGDGQAVTVQMNGDVSHQPSKRGRN